MSLQLLQGSPEPQAEDPSYDDWYLDEPQEPTLPPNEIIPECDPTLSEGLYHVILAPLSLGIMLLLSFLVKRRTLCRTRCKGVPGLLSPLNLLEDSGNRWIPCAVFGLLFSSLCRLLLDPSTINFILEYGGQHQELWKILALFYYPALYYPLLACYGVQRTAGYILGTLLSWLHCGALIWQKAECPQTKQFYRYYSLLSTVPQICCLLLLSAVYPALLLQSLRQSSDYEQKFDKNCYLKYLKRLLNRKLSNSSKDTSKLGSQVLQAICSYLFPSNTGIHLSLRSILAITVSVLSAYQVALIMLVIFLPTVQTVRRSIDMDFILMLTGFGLIVDNDKSQAVKYIVYYIWTVEACYIAALVLSCAVTITMLLRSIVKHRLALQSLFAGQVSLVFLQPRSLHPTSAGLSSWMSHVSYQAAVTCLGLILQHVVLFVCFLFVTFLIIIPIAYGKFQLLLPILESTWPFWLLLFLVMLAQHLCSRFIFLQGHPAQINNRRCLFMLTYLLLPVNTLRGGLLALCRLLVSVIFNVIHFCRLDLSLLQHSVQGWDPGYRNYCHFLMVEFNECHPLVRAFCLLLRPPRGNKIDLEEGIQLMQSESKPNKGVRSHLARARWSLAYTLIHNPSLQRHRVTTNINGNIPPCPT
ncbi:receptor for retinol uptake STRA6 [Bombina bombina]|uniref:receptor for retinol uptake STRA6 n=1 Tax=Bombina bombina TaxID=8345 RepID=UPI00235AD829|nr:receptor for retinol uptake STRA6 [Bombina bombina]